jgi:hypothetical protein
MFANVLYSSGIHVVFKQIKGAESKSWRHGAFAFLLWGFREREPDRFS